MKFLLVLLFAYLCVALPLDTAGQTAALDDHNTARIDALPPPENPLGDLTYDTTIESFSSSYANNCVYEHSTGSGYGENLYATSVDFAGDLAAMMNAADSAWESEEDDYTLTESGDSCSNVCGHYTQMVWDDTERIGCGWARCNTNSPFGASFPDWTFVVCNYDPPGNFIGQLPYVVSDGCDVPTECANAGIECGDASICSGVFNCGECNAGFECNAGICEEITGPCASCLPNTECVNDECVCLPGYVEVGGFCELADPDAPNVSGDFTQTLPVDAANFIDQDSGQDLILVQSGDHYLRWDLSPFYFDLSGTTFTLNVHQNDGSFGIGAFHGQPDYENDMFKWVVTDIVNGVAGLQICIGRFGFDYCSVPTPISFTDEEHRVTVEISVSGGTVFSTFQIDNSYIWQTETELTNFSNIGSVAYFLSPILDTPIIKEATIYSGSGFGISLFGCLDDVEYEAVYNEYTGLSGAPTRAPGENGNCV